jgi:hypothetical protein
MNKLETCSTQSRGTVEKCSAKCRYLTKLTCKLFYLSEVAAGVLSVCGPSPPLTPYSHTQPEAEKRMSQVGMSGWYLGRMRSLKNT